MDTHNNQRGQLTTAFVISEYGKLSQLEGNINGGSER